MAGIGFRLQKLLAGDSYASTLKAYAYSALVAAGPFLMTVLVVAGMHWVSLENLSPDEQAVLKSLVTYAFMASMLAVSVSQMVITRHVADEYYRGHTGHFTAVLLSSFAWHAALAAPPILLYASGLAVSWTARLSFLLLVLFTIGTWLALIFLSAARDYRRMTLGFVAGSVASLAASALLGRDHGLDGYLAGFTAGQGLIFFLLAGSVVAEFGVREAHAPLWPGYFRRHPRLAAIGLLYAAGLWVDKLLFWFSPEGVVLDRGLAHCPIYDVPLFFAYVSVIPSLAYFLMQMETDFFVKYQAYYRAIQRQETLQSLERRRREMVATLAASLGRLVLIQGSITAAALLCVPLIVSLLGMDPLQMGVLRIGLFASFLQVAFLIALNLLLYFDFQGEALASCLVFAASNAALTAYLLGRSPAAYGYGYTLACGAALALAATLLNERLSRLHYWTFMRQPIPRPAMVFDEDLDPEDGVA